MISRAFWLPCSYIYWIRNFIAAYCSVFCLSSSSFCIERSSILSDKSCIFSSISERDMLISSICETRSDISDEISACCCLNSSSFWFASSRLSCVVAYEMYGIVRDRLKVQAANIYFLYVIKFLSFFKINPKIKLLKNHVIY